MQENYDSHTSNSTPNFVTFFFTPIYTDLKKCYKIIAATLPPIKYLKFLKIYVIIYIENEKKEKR